MRMAIKFVIRAPNSVLSDIEPVRHKHSNLSTEAYQVSQGWELIITELMRV
jgi:hypothetical protein